VIWQIDWCTLEYGKCKQVADFVAVEYSFDVETFLTDEYADIEDRRLMNNHFLVEEKSRMESMRALKFLISQKLVSHPHTKHIILVSDGGRSDFKCKEWLSIVMNLEALFPDLKITSIILAPYHGSGACDAAKSHAQKKITNYIGNGLKHVSKFEDLASIVDLVYNTVAWLPKGTNDELFGELEDEIPVNSMNGISDYFHFEYKPLESKVLGWERSNITPGAPNRVWGVSSPSKNTSKRHNTKKRKIGYSG
jgi:hypothetical protein